jgi:rhodanese-related sulfurtransferase
MEIPEVPEVDVHEAQRRVQGGALLLDVRQPEEFAELRIPGSTLLPLSGLQARLEELPKDRDIVVHCRSGARSARATEFLIQHGYQASNVAGGLLAWKEAELPLEEGRVP